MQLEQSHAVYPISTVSNMTGVNSVTLRAWERRYGLIKPERTKSGHRLYSDVDIRQIKQILELLDEGISIGRVKDTLLIAANELQTDKAQTHWETYQKDMNLAVANFNEGTLESVYDEAMSLYPVDVVTSQLILPLLKILGRKWANSSTGVAEEHFFSTFLRNKLGARFHHRNLQNKGPKIIAACLPEEQHEFGILLFSLAAHARGYRIVLLGANMPISELAKVAKQTNSNGFVLSGSFISDGNLFLSELSKLVKDSSLPVWIGGQTSITNKKEINLSGAHPIGTDLVSAMRLINKILPVNK